MCAESARGSGRTTGDRLGISPTTFRVFERGARLVFSVAI